MSGECQKCNEHCLDCRCKNRSNILMGKPKFPIEIDLNGCEQFKELIARVEKLEKTIELMTILEEVMKKHFPNPET